MKRVTDEVTTYVEREEALRDAHVALCKRFGIEQGDVNAALGVRWKLVRWPWRDRAEELAVQWLNPDYRDSCVESSDADPVYFLTTATGEYGRLYHRIFEKALRDPDEVKDCRYVVAFWRENECVWACTFFTFREADDFAFEEAKKYLDSNGTPRNEDAGRASSVSLAGNYIEDQVAERYWDNDAKAEIRMATIDFGEENYPYEYEQEVA